MKTLETESRVKPRFKIGERMALARSKTAKAAKKAAPKIGKKSSKLSGLKDLILGTNETKTASRAKKAKANVKKVSGAKKKKKAVKAQMKAVSESTAEAAKSIIEKLSARSEKEIQAASTGICFEPACDNLATSGGFCRLHYIRNWKKIKRKELILKEGKLNRYIEELVAKYPDKYIEAIRQDLVSDKEFGKVIHDLELDEGIDDFDIETESVDHLIDSIRRDIDDDGDF